MANKDRKDSENSVSKLVTSSLDNVKRFIDRTSDEVAKADLLGANRRIADHVIEGTKETFEKVADTTAKRDPLGAVRVLAIGIIDGAKDIVRIATEESQRINLIETGSKVTQEGLDLLHRQVEITFDATSEVSETVGGAVDGAMDGINSGLKDVSSNINNGISNIGNMMPNVNPFNMGKEGEAQKRPGVITRVEIESDKVTPNKESQTSGSDRANHAAKK